MDSYLKRVGTTLDVLPTLDNQLEGYDDTNHPVTDICRHNAFREEIHYVNESLNDVCVINSAGIIVKIPGTRRNRKRLIVVRKITTGTDVDIYLYNMRKILGEEGAALIDYLGNVIDREKNAYSRTITLYYVMPIDNIEMESTGLHHLKLGLTLFDKKFMDTIVPYDAIKPEVFGPNGTPIDQFGGSISLVHVPEVSSSTQSVFLTIGNDILEVPPVNTDELPPGLHMLPFGNVKKLSKNEVIKPVDYKRYGIYDSYSRLAEAMGSKDKTAELISVIKDAVKVDEIEIPKMRFTQRKLYDEYSVEDVADEVESVSKVVGKIAGAFVGFFK